MPMSVMGIGEMRMAVRYRVAQVPAPMGHSGGLPAFVRMLMMLVVNVLMLVFQGRRA